MVKNRNTTAVLHASGDADVLIFDSAIESVQTKPTMLIGSDTDLKMSLIAFRSEHNTN